MATQHTGQTQPSIDLEEHRSLGGVNAKAVVNYGFANNILTPTATPFLDVAFDYIGFTNADANGNYQTWTFKTGGSAGTTVRTLTVAYDASNNITSIARS